MILFLDVDDTLYDLMSSFRKTHEELFSDRTDASAEDLFWASRKYNAEAFELWNKGLLTKTEEFYYRIRKSYADYGAELSDEELERFRVCYRNCQDRISLMPGMEELLARLQSKGAELYILTNGNHKDQFKKIQTLGILNRIPEKRIFISEDLPAPKPELPAYREIEARTGISPETVWYVGDTFAVDIVGAYRAGWHSIWFNHRRKPMPDGPEKPDRTVTTVGELSEVLDALMWEETRGTET